MASRICSSMSGSPDCSQIAEICCSASSAELWVGAVFNRWNSSSSFCPRALSLMIGAASTGGARNRQSNVATAKRLMDLPRMLVARPLDPLSLQLVLQKEDLQLDIGQLRVDRQRLLVRRQRFFILAQRLHDHAHAGDGAEVPRLERQRVRDIAQRRVVLPDEEVERCALVPAFGVVGLVDDDAV